AGDTLTLAYRIAGHVATSLGNVAVASRERDRIVQAFGEYFTSAARGDNASYRAYAVRASNGPEKLGALTRLLDHNGIRYGYASSRVTGDGYRYADGSEGRVTVEAGDLVVPARQPNGRLARVLFEPAPSLSDSLTYDITAWALPFAHGLDAVAVRSDVPTGTSTRTTNTTTPGTAGPAYAYAFSWGDAAGARVLGRLFAAGVRVRTTQTPSRVAGQDLPAGSLVVTRADNARLGSRFDVVVAEAARTAGAPVIALSTGFAETGSDLGAGTVSPIRAPRVLVVSGEGVSTSGLGEVWHWFDEEVGYPVTLANGSDVNAGTLARFDVVVMPAGSYGRIFDDARLSALRTWIEAGGTLVALESAVGFLAGKEGFAIKRREGETARDTLAVFGDRERQGLTGSVPGAVYRVTLDPTHPLAFGYGSHTFTLLRSDAAYPYLAEGWNVGTLRGDAHVAGFTGSRARKRLQDVLVYGVQDKGQGAVVYLVDGPLFRRFWRATELIFANAVFRF
ncbi:MAG TPA: zinc carboxypeptidase, partial [Rhodothermales bacterium]|nr:zinc carboxypeptidase [Rhodothermales bacterium]